MLSTNDWLDKQNAGRRSNVCLPIINYIFLTKTFKKRIKAVLDLVLKVNLGLSTLTGIRT